VRGTERPGFALVPGGACAVLGDERNEAWGTHSFPARYSVNRIMHESYFLTDL